MSVSRADLDRLYELLPAIYRIRDVESERGEPLRALLQVISEQVNLVEADIDQLYLNWFIETCQEWVTPYLGDLVGYRQLPGAAIDNAREAAALIPRRDVANTVANRRRKGTLALLEQLAADVAGWPARAVEFYTLLALAQALNHQRLERGRTADLRAGDALDRLDGPFDELAHLVSVGRINSTRTRSMFNIPSVGLFVWRLRPYRLTWAPAYCFDRARHRYTFSILGVDTPLINLPLDEPSPTHIAGELNVPAFIRRRAFDERPADYYGPGKSFEIFFAREGDADPVSIPLDRIVPADLTNWGYRPGGDRVAVDPVLGRIAFAGRNPPAGDVWVSWHNGFADDLGGGEYVRPRETTRVQAHYTVGRGREFTRIDQALEQWEQDKADGKDVAHALIEIVDNREYQEQLTIQLRAGERLELRAGLHALAENTPQTRPIISIGNLYGRADMILVEGIRPEDEAAPLDAGKPEQDQAQQVEPPQLVLDGLLIAGGPVRLSGWLGDVAIRHCTLAPGLMLDPDCEPRHAEAASLELDRTSATLCIERSILGTIVVRADEVQTDPGCISMIDTILDATDPGRVALAGPDQTYAHSVLIAERCTIIGRILTHAVELGQDTLFDGVMQVARRQLGCLRFCYVPPGSRTPRRYSCQPDRAFAAVRAEFPDTDETREIRARALRLAEVRIRPRFESMRYGSPFYCRLRDDCPDEIRRGASDESEMGVYHDLFEPQRADNLQARMDEYLPAVLDGRVIPVT
jgi:hypothetical protein